MADEIIIETTSAEVIEVSSPGPQGPKGADGAGLSTLTTKGDTLFRGDTTGERLPIGTTGQILRVSSNGLPEWGAAPASGVSSVNGKTGNVNLNAADVGAVVPSITSLSISGDTSISAGRNQIIYLNATVGTSANINLPFSGNQNGDVFTFIASFLGNGNTGSLTIQVASQLVNGVPLAYAPIYTLTTHKQSITLITNGSGVFEGWSTVSLGRHLHSIADVTNLQSSLDGKQASGSYPTTDNAVQEYNVTGVLLPNGDTGSGVQLTRNTATPQAPDGSDRTFNAEQLIYTRVNGNSLRMDTFLKDKSQWFWTSVPSTKTSTGTTSQVAYDSNYFYICVATNKWVRIALATNW